MSILERAIAKSRTRSPEEGKRAPAEQARPRTNPPAAALPTSGPTIELHRQRLQQVGLAGPADMEPVLAEELRVIKRPLLLNAEREDEQLSNAGLVMIASALPGAGKTFMSFNLALSVASEVDWNVLLIDADVSRPTLSRALGVADAPGLVGLLEDTGGALADYAIRTSHPGLHFLPAGPPRSEAKELLSSQRMRSLVADLASLGKRQLVVMDSPPLLLTSEARVLAGYAGQVVMVVEAGVTPRRSLSEAIDVLDPAKAINLVLNKSRQILGTGEYRYYAYGNEPVS